MARHTSRSKVQEGRYAFVLIFAPIVVTSATLDDARAMTILARCGPSTGQSYYFEGGIVGPGQGGFKKDGFDGGRILAYMGDDEKVNLILKDGTGTRSYLKQGWKVDLVEVDTKNRSFLLTASGLSFVETYLFKTNEYGVGTVAWTASKITAGVTRTSIMTAECGPSFTINP